MNEDDESTMRKVLSRIADLSKGVDSPELVALAMEGLKVVHAEKGLIRSRFFIPNGLSVSTLILPFLYNLIRLDNL